MHHGSKLAVKEPPENILQKGRLQPGRIFLIDFEQGRMISDHELKERIVSQKPYETWLNNHRLELSDISRALPRH